MRRIAVGMAVVAAAAVAGCGSGGGGGVSVPSLNSRAAVAARADLAAITVRGLLGVAQFAASGAGTTGVNVTSISDPADPTNKAVLYAQTTHNSDGTTQVAFFHDAAHTQPAGTAAFGAVQSFPGGGLPATENVQLNNVSSLGLTGPVLITVNDLQGHGTMQFRDDTYNVNGASETLNGTANFTAATGTSAATVTLANSGAPLQVTEAGQTIGISLTNVAITENPSTGQGSVTGTAVVNPGASDGTNGNVQYNADGSSTALNPGVISLTVDTGGNVAVSILTSAGAVQGSFNLGVLKAGITSGLNPNNISL